MIARNVRTQEHRSVHLGSFATTNGYVGGDDRQQERLGEQVTIPSEWSVTPRTMRAPTIKVDLERRGLQPGERAERVR